MNKFSLLSCNIVSTLVLTATSIGRLWNKDICNGGPYKTATSVCQASRSKQQSKIQKPVQQCNASCSGNIKILLQKGGSFYFISSILQSLCHLWTYEFHIFTSCLSLFLGPFTLFDCSKVNHTTIMIFVRLWRLIWWNGSMIGDCLGRIKPCFCTKTKFMCLRV